MNRKLTLIILTSIVVFINMEAQKHPQFRYISFNAGLNMAGVSPAGQYDKYQKNLGLHLGISGNYSFNDATSVGASVNFEQVGAAHRVYDINTNLNYISLPVYMKWVMGKEPRLFLTTGIYSALLINAKMSGNQFIDGRNTIINEEVTGDFRPFDFGLTLGGGLMVRLYDDIDFMVSVNGAAGLTGISDNLEKNPRNYHLNVSVGYIYYIGYR